MDVEFPVTDQAFAARVVASLTEGVVVLGLDGRVLTANPALLAVLELDSDAARIGRCRGVITLGPRISAPRNHEWLPGTTLRPRMEPRMEPRLRPRCSDHD